MLLIVGLTPEQSLVVRRAARRASEALRVASAGDVGSVPVAEWEDATVVLAGPSAEAAELRRLAPAAVLVRLGDRDSDVDGLFDDVLSPTDLGAPWLLHLLRWVVAAGEAHDRLSEWALRDPLTGLLNRRGLDQLLGREAARRARGHGPLVAILVDCDDFKHVNDRFGLDAGDRALQRVATSLVGAVREGDLVARVGGDEFAIVLPETRTWEAVAVADRVRRRVPDEVVLADGRPLTVSLGVARLPEDARSVAAVVRATQQGLRLSKARGKGRARWVLPSGAAAREGGPRRGPGRPPAVHRWTGRRHPDGAEECHLLRMEAPETEQQQLAAQRATDPRLDLRWYREALASASETALPLFVPLYPATVRDLPWPELARPLPGWMARSQLVIVLDELYLSGPAGGLRPAVDALDEVDVRLCIEVSELSRSCVEAMVVLRPAYVLSAAPMVRHLARRRPEASVYRRFADVSRALGCHIVAALPGDATDADRAAAADLGVHTFATYTEP